MSIDFETDLPRNVVVYHLNPQLFAIESGQVDIAELTRVVHASTKLAYGQMDLYMKILEAACWVFNWDSLSLKGRAGVLLRNVPHRLYLRRVVGHAQLLHGPI